METLHKQVLQLLHEDARQSAERIATLLGISETEVKQIVQELEQSKVILRHTVVVNWEKVQTERVTAVIDVKVTPQREVGFDAIARRVYRFPEVTSVSLMSGAYDLQVVVEGRHIKEVAQFVAEKLSTIEHVTGTTTHFLLKTYKSDGVIFDDLEDDQRLVVSP